MVKEQKGMVSCPSKNQSVHLELHSEKKTKKEEEKEEKEEENGRKTMDGYFCKTINSNGL